MPRLARNLLAIFLVTLGLGAVISINTPEPRAFAQVVAVDTGPTFGERWDAELAANALDVPVAADDYGVDWDSINEAAPKAAVRAALETANAAIAAIEAQIATIGGGGYIDVTQEPYNAVADNETTDDTEAFQDALDAAAVYGGTVFVPRGASNNYYKITETLNIPVGVRFMSGSFSEAGGAHLLSNVPGMTLLDPAPNSKNIVSGLRLTSQGHCINAEQIAFSKYENLFLDSGDGYWGYVGENNTFGVILLGVNAVNNAGHGNGICFGGHTVCIQPDVVGCLHGIVILGPTSSSPILIGGRVEVNYWGLEVGVTADGVASVTGNAIVLGGTYESNVYNVTVRASHLTMIGVFAHAFPDAPYGENQPIHSVALYTAADCFFINCSFQANAPGSAAGYLGSVSGTWFHNTDAQNPQAPDGCDWSRTLDLAVNKNTISGSSNLPGFTEYTFAPNAIMTTSLAAFDLVHPAVRGKNLRILDIPVAEGATSNDFTFQTALGGGALGLTATAANTGGATLAEDTYYYLSGGTTAVAEAAGVISKVVVASPNNSVSISGSNFSGTNYYRKIYRGTGGVESVAKLTIPGDVITVTTVDGQEYEDAYANGADDLFVNFNQDQVTAEYFPGTGEIALRILGEEGTATTAELAAAFNESVAVVDALSATGGDTTMVDIHQTNAATVEVVTPGSAPSTQAVIEITIPDIITITSQAGGPYELYQANNPTGVEILFEQVSAGATFDTGTHVLTVSVTQAAGVATTADVAAAIDDSTGFEATGGSNQTVSSGQADDATIAAVSNGYVVYNGCWQLADGADSMVDIGQAFDIVGAQPPPDGIDNTTAEPDDDYRIWIAPSWATTWGTPVADIETTGFHVDFGTAAPAGATYSAELIR